RLGMPGALVVAGIANLLVAGVAAWLARGEGVDAPLAQEAFVPAGGAAAARSPVLRVVLWADLVDEGPGAGQQPGPHHLPQRRCRGRRIRRRTAAWASARRAARVTAWCCGPGCCPAPVPSSTRSAGSACSTRPWARPRTASS